jgi:O-antigen/teichoic acid export membrane protein
MRYWQKFRLDLLICTAFLVLPLLLLADVTFGGKTMLPVDNLYQWEPWASAAEEQGITTPQNPLISDLIIQNYNWRKFTKESFLEQGEIPLWNPYLFAGVPFLAAGQHSAYYPLSLLFFFMPIPAAYGWFALLQLWLTGVFMYLFARVLGTGRGGAAIAGLVYQGSGFMLTSTAVFPMIIAAAAWLPLLLACIELIINRDWRSESRELASHHQSSIPQSPLIWVAAGAIALGLQIFAGHVEITYYTLLIMGLYAAYRLFTNRQSPMTALFRQAGWLAAMVTLGLMLGAVQLIPLFELGQVNFRQDATTFDQVQSYAFPVRRVLTLAMPNFYGNPAHHSTVDPFTGQTIPFTVDAQGNPNPTSEWGIKNYVEGGIYLGVLPLLLAVLGTAGGWLAGSRRRIHTVFFAGLSFLSLAFIFGTPLYAIIYYGLPFANQLNTPFRWVFPLTLAVAVLAGFGTDRLARGAWRVGTFNLQSLISNLAVLGGLGVLAGLFVSWWGYGRFQPIITRLFNTLALANTGFANAHEFYSYEFWQVLVFGLMLLGSGLVLWLGKNSKNSASFAAKLKPYWLLLAFLLLTADLATANWGFHAANDPALLAYKPEMVSWLEEQEGLWRLTSYTPQGDKPFNANSAWLFNFQDVRGYDSMIPKQYTDYMGVVEPQHELPFNRVQPVKSTEALDSPLLDVLNVRFVITSSTIESPKYRLAWEGEGVRIYENLGAAPRAYTLPLGSTAVSDDSLTALTKYDPRQHVVIDDKDWKVAVGDSMPAAQSPQPARLAPAPVAEYTNIQLTAHAEVSEPSWLVIGDTYFPGWKAYIRPFGTGEDQETQVPIVRVNGNFRGVVLEPGHWTIRMRYSPVSFQLGALASFMGGIILLFAGVVWVWQHMVNPNAKMTTTRSIAKNSLAPMALNLFNKFIDFGYAAFYLRVLGPADAGSFATAIATAGIFEIIANFGLDILLIRDVSQAKEQAGRYLLNTSLLRIGMAVVGALPVAALVLGSQLGNNPFSQAEVLAIALIVAGMVFSGMSKGVTGLFYVYEQAEVPAAMTTVTTILKVGLGVAALFMGLGFVGLAAVSIIVNIITLSILTILALRRYTLTGPWTIDWTLQRQLLQKGYPLMLIHLLQTIFISIDVVILRLLLPNGEEVVGWYNSAYKWFNALQIVPSFFTLALFPIISRQIQSSIDGARRMYQMALKLMLLLALPVAAVTFFLAVPLVNIVAGAEFLPDGAVALQIVILSIPFGWMNSVTNYVLIALGLERMQPRAFLAAVVFNIVTNVLFIPMFTYRAAAVTTILSEVVLLVLFDYYLRKKMAGVNWLHFAGRPFLITAIMGAGMYLGGQIHMLVGLLAGLLIYPAGLWLLRVVGSEERLILAEILPTSIAVRLRLR